MVEADIIHFVFKLYLRSLSRAAESSISKALHTEVEKSGKSSGVKVPFCNVCAATLIEDRITVVRYKLSEEY